MNIRDAVTTGIILLNCAGAGFILVYLILRRIKKRSAAIESNQIDLPAPIKPKADPARRTQAPTTREDDIFKDIDLKDFDDLSLDDFD